MALSWDVESMLRDVNPSFRLALLAPVVGSVLISLLLTWQIRKRNDTSWICTLVETGALSAAAAITCSASSARLTIAALTVWIPFVFILGRVYSCTTLFVLDRCLESASALTGNFIETAHVGAPTSKGPRDVGMMVLSMPPVTVMDDADAFRLTQKKIGLQSRGRELEVDSDASSDISRNLNEELREMEEQGSRRASSLSSSRRASLSSDGNQSETPSEYPESPDPEPQSPRIPWGSISLLVSPRSPST